MTPLNITQQLAAAVRKVRDANAAGWILASPITLTPMRQVAFGDLNGDPDVGIPFTFAGETEAEARAAAWNDRLPAGYRPSLSIAAYRVSDWADAFTDTLDYEALIEGADGVEMPTPAAVEDGPHMDEVY